MVVTDNGHLFNLDKATCVYEDNGKSVYKTEGGNWCIFDEHLEAIVASLIWDQPGHCEVEFAETLVAHGLENVVVDHFAGVAAEVIPEA